ncbi:phage regulatory CII family protein [Microvirga mediterraneensis]|uniref:Uncharacterized protein n=1 Tax=Microvirga mediterraneensis TaxID=2754695 RepID=A0A838BQX8_9HYPH|nr:phage regulatory CII family protein [Microvirga mediterraneensis]MBA1157791.1 hypothetical protein [Microvirga mediterraneensis]
MSQDRGRILPFSGFKAAWRMLLDTLGGVSAVERADLTRGSASLLSRYGQVHESVFTPIDIMYEIEKAVVDAGGRPEFLMAYADALGFVAVPKAAVENPLPVLDTAAVEAIGAVGQMASAFYEAAKDGVITPKEAENLAAVGQKAGAEVHEFTEAAKARAAKGGR